MRKLCDNFYFVVDNFMTSYLRRKDLKNLHGIFSLSATEAVNQIYYLMSNFIL